MADFICKIRSTPLQQRKSDAMKISFKHPDRIPVVVDKDSKTSPDIDRHKFLCPKSLTMAEFSHVIRSRMKLKKEEALFLFAENNSSKSLVKMNSTLSEVWNQHHQEDNFLYIRYSLENTFGRKV